MGDKIVGWDVETHLIEAGNLTPPLVCLSASGGVDTLPLLEDWLCQQLPKGTEIHTEEAWARNRNNEWEVVVKADLAHDLWLFLAMNVDRLVAHKQVFDLAVMCNELPALLPIVTGLFEKGQLACTEVRERLWAIATDNFQFDTRRKRPTSFGLAYLVMTYFGVDISEDKVKQSIVTGQTSGNTASWRLRYKELSPVPLSQWPRKALTYASEDALWARRIYLEQARPLRVPAGVVVRSNGVLTNEYEQEMAYWVIYLMACHGVYTDPPAVRKFERAIRAVVERSREAAKQGGWLVVNRCKACQGTGIAGPPDDPSKWTTCPQCGGQDHETCNQMGVYGRYKDGRAKTLKPPSTNTSQKRQRTRVKWAYGGHPPLTEKGQVSINADALTGSGDSYLKEYAEGSTAEKLLNTYLPILLQGFNRPVTSNPNVLVRTGRTSWRDPNFQNPPAKHGFRECFIPRPGTVFCSIDYNALELSTFAQTCLSLFGHSDFAKTINSGRCPHCLVAAAIARLTPDHSMTTQDAVEEVLGKGKFKTQRSQKDHPNYTLFSELRDLAKVLNFGCLGGLGVESFVKYAAGFGHELSFNRADELIKTWKATIRETKDFFGMISQASRLSMDGTFTVKQLGTGRLRAGCTYTSGCNTYFQGLAADGAKAALWELYKACYIDKTSPLFGVRMWAFIHDEVLLEGPEETAHIWAPEAARIMVAAMARYVPDCPAGAEPALMRRWTKKAEPVYDENGRLVVWTE